MIVTAVLRNIAHETDDKVPSDLQVFMQATTEVWNFSELPQFLLPQSNNK